MLRRQFFTRTIGALVGAVCAPLLGKAVATPLTDGVKVFPFPTTGIKRSGQSSDEIIACLDNHRRELFERAVDDFEAEWDRQLLYGDGR